MTDRAYSPTIKEFIRRGIIYAGKRCKIPCDPRSAKYKTIEACVPKYKLPEILKMSDGTSVEDQWIWRNRRRHEIIELFRANVYGRSPSSEIKMQHEIISVEEKALNGIATRKEVRIGLAEESKDMGMTLLLYLPNKLTKLGIKTPLFLGLNYFGNHTIHIDPCISITNNWIVNNSITKGRPPEMMRGVQSSSWPVEFILNQNYGVATAYYGDITPDRNDGLELGIHKWFLEKDPYKYRATEDSWGAISGWAWGLSRAMDYLERDGGIEANKIAVIGHSRLGKASLWAGAQDERFAIVISNNSGCGGAALFRRRFDETVAKINSSFPHWFCEKFKRYNNREEDLPIDQHELISLIAPRPVYVASAQMDLHADPMGEFLATKHANIAYYMFDKTGLPSEELPEVDMPVMGTIGYHMRKGGHGITLFDWAQFIKFADIHFS
jgi:hypothetical protein